MRCLRFYTVWLANDEAAQACAILCWLQAGGFFYPSPYICDKGELIPTVPTQQLPEGTRLAILILTNSHWMGAEAEQKWDEWDPRFVGTTAEQCLRLTAELEPHLPTPAKIGATTIAPWVDIPHLCGWQVLHRWFSTSVQLRPDAHFSRHIRDGVTQYDTLLQRSVLRPRPN